MSLVKKKSFSCHFGFCSTPSVFSGNFKCEFWERTGLFTCTSVTALYILLQQTLLCPVKTVRCTGSMMIFRSDNLTCHRVLYRKGTIWEFTHPAGIRTVHSNLPVNFWRLSWKLLRPSCSFHTCFLFHTLESSEKKIYFFFCTTLQDAVWISECIREQSSFVLRTMQKCSALFVYSKQSEKLSVER